MQKISRKTFSLFVAVIVMFALTATAWGHGEGTSIVPASLSAKAGGELQVKVNGLTSTKTATFKLTGMTGKFDLGTYDISSDDFTQSLKIPADVPPGSYRLTVEGGKKNAKVVITIN